MLAPCPPRFSLSATGSSRGVPDVPRACQLADGFILRVCVFRVLHVEEAEHGVRGAIPEGPQERGFSSRGRQSPPSRGPPPPPLTFLGEESNPPPPPPVRSTRLPLLLSSSLVFSSRPPIRSSSSSISPSVVVLSPPTPFLLLLFPLVESPRPSLRRRHCRRPLPRFPVTR